MSSIIEEQETVCEVRTPSLARGFLSDSVIEERPKRLHQGMRAMTNRIITLECEAAQQVRLAKTVDVDIEYLGIAPLPNGPRVYSGTASDWVFAPATADDAHYIPRAQRRKLERLEESGFHMPTLFVAHEVSKGNISQIDNSLAGTVVDVTEHEARKAVGPIPPPKGTVDVAERLSERAHQVFSVIGKAVPTIGAIVAAPFLLAGAVVSTTLDPIIFGVIPAKTTTPGDLAAWYVLARWDW